MKRVVLAAAAALLALSMPATAQYGGGYYGGGGGGYGGGGYGGGGYDRGGDDDEDYAPRRRGPPRGYDPYGGQGGGYGGGRRAQAGSVCVTSRGSCYTRPVPLNSQCRCDIPGFGVKRGNVLQ